MPPRVKICCIASLDEARLAQAAGAAALGLVSAMPSGPGVIDDALITDITTAMSGTSSGNTSGNTSDQSLRTFLLTSRTSAQAIVQQHAAAGTTTLQLVDHVALAELRLLRLLCPQVELVQVIHVVDDSALNEALAVAPFVDAVLLDSGRPQATVKELGGTGRTHNWALSRRIRDALSDLPTPVPLWLAGGLRADNVAQAVQQVQPHGLDLCNGVRRDGRLDATLLRSFMEAVHAAA
jgi:phosphoribosylanthranilate isomerase